MMDLGYARRFAEAIHVQFPGKLLAYDCSPSFDRKLNLDDKSFSEFHVKLGAMGYKFQFITLADWHMVNLNAFELAKASQKEGKTAYVRLQEREFASEEEGYTAARPPQQPCSAPPRRGSSSLSQRRLC